MTDWRADQLGELDTVPELRITGPRADGSWPSPVPIWVVTVGGEAYVRTWRRRETGWYGRAVRYHRARIVLHGEEIGVSVQGVGDQPGDLVQDVDAAYRTKYGRTGDGSVSGMVGAEARASTLRLAPEDPRTTP